MCFELLHLLLLLLILINLANVLSIFLIKGKPLFSNFPGHLPINYPNCTVLVSWFLNNALLGDNLFTIALKRFQIFRFFMLHIIYLVGKKTILHLMCYNELYYTDITLKQNEFTENIIRHVLNNERPCCLLLFN